MKKRREEVYNFLLDIGKQLSKTKLGGLFIISPKGKFKDIYEPLYPQVISNTNIFEKGAKILILKLAELDGAFLIEDDGTLVAFGARIKKSKALKGFGTKHAAAVGVTKYIQNSSAILISEETGWIKIFKNGRIIIKMDNSITSKSITHKIITFVTDNDTALLATAGVSAAIAGFIPVVIVTGTYLVIKTASGVIRKTLNF